MFWFNKKILITCSLLLFLTACGGGSSSSNNGNDSPDVNSNNDCVIGVSNIGECSI